MASPADLGQNLPDTLPEDFGEWDSEGASAPVRTEVPSSVPYKTSPQDALKKESAPGEVESVDSSKKAYAARDVAQKSTIANSVTPFPESDAAPVVTRGFPAPAMRAPRKATSPDPIAAPPPDETVVQKQSKSLDTVVDRLPADQSKMSGISGATSVLERMPERPLFSSLAMNESEDDETESSAIRFDELLEAEEERKARRKWIMSACIFGGSLLLVTFQLLHYSSPERLKSMVAATQTAATSSDSDLNNVDLFSHAKPAAAHVSEGELSSSSQSPGSDDASSEPSQPETTPVRTQTQMMQTQLMAPTRLPQSVKTVASNDAPPPASLAGASIAALNGNNNVGSVFADQPNASVSGPRLVSVSAGVAAGYLIHVTQPVYPAIAKSARIQGTVVLAARISQTGSVTNLKVVSGPPMLRQTAMDAVKTWQYKPYMLNNQPAIVDTTISVVFTLGE